MLTPLVPRGRSLLCLLAALGAVGCFGGTESKSDERTEPEPRAFWPWLADYESPGCTQPNVSCSSFVDARDGKTYRAVTVGAQTWMGTALNYGEFTAEPVSSSPEGGVFKRCPLGEPEWCDRAGALYTWHTMMALPEACEAEECLSFVRAPHQGICPDGWHVPTIEETTTLLDAVGTAVGPDCDTGAALKATKGWVNVNGEDVNTDSSGLSVFPQTMAERAGTVWVTRTGIWTASIDARGAGLLSVSYGSDCALLDRYFANTNRIESVRCVED